MAIQLRRHDVSRITTGWSEAFRTPHTSIPSRFPAQHGAIAPRKRRLGLNQVNGSDNSVVTDWHIVARGPTGIREKDDVR